MNRNPIFSHTKDSDRNSKRITINRNGVVCAECGALLPIGSKAMWYPYGLVYGLDCHENFSDRPPVSTNVKIGNNVNIENSKF